MSTQQKFKNLSDYFTSMNYTQPNSSTQSTDSFGSTSTSNNINGFIPLMTNLFADIATNIPYDQKFFYKYPKDDEKKDNKPNKILCNTYETDNTYIAKFSVPGLEKKDIKVTIKDLVLTVECNVVNNILPVNVHINEFEYGKLQRIIKLPVVVNENAKVETSLVNGILELIFSKHTCSQSKEIPL